MKISCIVAVGPNREIGCSGKMLWNYPDEYDHFLKTVSGHCILMGRVNWDDNANNYKLLGRVSTLVVTSKKYPQQYLPANLCFDVSFFHSIEDAIAGAKDRAEKELFIIGGERIYQQTLDLVDRIYYSVVPFEGIADTFFPEISKDFIITFHKKYPAIGDTPAWELFHYDRIHKKIT